MAVTLILEDGSGLTNSNSYIDPDYCDTHFTQKGTNPADWHPTPDPDTGGVLELKKAACIAASQFVDFMFRPKFKGGKVTKMQAMAWPRVGARIDEGQSDGSGVWIGGYYGGFGGRFLIDANEIPDMLKKCCAEFALVGLGLGNWQFVGNMAPDIQPEDWVQQETLKGLSTTYVQGRPMYTLNRMAQLFLNPILQTTGPVVPMVRG